MTDHDREIVSSRLFDAPRERVFRAWSDPELLARWWGPKGFTNTFHEFDFRPDGHWRFTMHAPNGGNFANENVFDEITPPERITFRHISPPVFAVTATFTEQGAQTLLTYRMLFPTAEACAKVKSFAPAANEENFDRLAAVLAHTSPI
jgi:uncharacterized protein YndB with AHSA1/START domain